MTTSGTGSREDGAKNLVHCKLSSAELGTFTSDTPLVSACAKVYAQSQPTKPTATIRIRGKGMKGKDGTIRS